MIDYTKERVVIVGLGLSGLSCVNFFCAHGVIPKVIDTRILPPGLNYLPNNIECWLGSLNEKWLLNATLIVVSPGIPLSNPILIAAAKIGIEIIGDIELFMRETTLPIVAITGSNGKSTVVSLLDNMLKYVDWQVGIGGNIGIPALTLLNKSYQSYILELSSFQLETTHHMHSMVAIILNISEDHMNRYPCGIEQYLSAKIKIYQNTDLCIININDVLTAPLINKYSNYSSFGIELGDYQLKCYNKQIWLMAYNELLMNCTEMKIYGYHNYVNALAALALADAMSIPRSASLTGLKNFKGLSHRFELIHERNGVRWINDSKSTNVSSTIAAINSVNTTGTLHLLLGGDGKFANFSPLLRLIYKKKHIKVYCFGRDGNKIAAIFPGNNTIVTEKLEQAMYIISDCVKRGDLVLLSPGCSSLDQFKNFEMRGNMFTQLAQEIG